MDMVFSDSLTDNHRVDGRTVVAGENIPALFRFVFPSVDFQAEPEMPQKVDSSDRNFIKQTNLPFKKFLNWGGRRCGISTRIEAEQQKLPLLSYGKIILIGFE